MEIIGNLTAAATVKTVKGQKEVVNFTVAVDNYYKPKNGEARKNTAFYNCSLWTRTGIVPYLTKGALVQVTGDVTLRTWNNKDGEARGSMNCHVNNIKLHSSSKSSKVNTDQFEEAEFTSHDASDDLPF